MESRRARGQMQEMGQKLGRVHLQFTIPARGLIGYRSGF